MGTGPPTPFLLSVLSHCPDSAQALLTPALYPHAPFKPRGPPPPTLRDDSMAQTLWAVPHTGCVGPVVLRLKPPTSLANFASLRACLQQGWAPKLGARQSVWPGKELFWEFL